MKRIGLIGGMSWESTAEYYRIINEATREHLGGTHSADCLVWSFDFAHIHRLQEEGGWEAAGKALAGAALTLERAGAELLVLCTNTMHRVAAAITGVVRIPLIHIGDVAGAAVRSSGIERIGLLGTRFTMEGPTYRAHLEDHFGLEVLTPDADSRRVVDRVIYDELVRGVIDDGSRREYVAIIEKLRERGAQGVILGCTEIELLIDGSMVDIPVFPTTRMHALAAVDAAIR